MALNDGNNDGRRTIETKSPWLENMKKKHEVKAKDAEALVPKKFDMADLDYVNAPGKMHVIGSPETESARPKKPMENTGVCEK